MKNDIITSDDILGKDVVDVDGDILGVVQQLKISKESKKILGILVDQGFMKPDIFIGLDHILNFGVDSVFLKKSPNIKLKGMDVYDRHGKKLGAISDVIEKGGAVQGIVIKKANSMGKLLFIKSRDVKTIGSNVILRNTEEHTRFYPIAKKENSYEPAS